MSVFTAIGVFVVVVLVGAVALSLLRLLWEVFVVWWMIVRARAVQKRQGVLKSATLGDWLRSMRRLYATDWQFDCAGVIVPRSPFKPLRKDRYHG